MRLSLRLSLIFLFLLLTSNFLLPIYGQVWLEITPKAGADQVDTLRPSGDRDGTDWYDVPSAGDDHEKIDEITPDEDTTYLWHDNIYANRNQGWAHTDFSTSNTLDSVRLTIRARTTAIDGTSRIAFGRRWSDGEQWWDCAEGGGTDTIYPATTWTNYNVTWGVDPCSGDPWTTGILNSATRTWWFKSYAVGSGYNAFGQDTGSVPTNQTLNYIVLYRFQADFTGEVDSIAMEYSDLSSVGNSKYAIYSDKNSYPYQCLDSTTSGATANGWKKRPLYTGNISVVSGTYYWLAWRHSATGDSIKQGGTGGPTGYLKYKNLASYTTVWPGTQPDSVPAGYGSANRRDNMIAFTNPAAENQVTWSSVVVFSHVAVAGGKHGKNILDGGILR